VLTKFVNFNTRTYTHTLGSVKPSHISGITRGLAGVAILFYKPDDLPVTQPQFQSMEGTY